MIKNYQIKIIFNQKIKSKKTRSLDLHGKTLDEANQIIENFYKKIL